MVSKECLNTEQNSCGDLKQDVPEVLRFEGLQGV